MDLRDLLDKLDTIEQTQLLTESEELMERVGLRLQDIEAAVGRELDGDKRAAIIGDFARKYGYAGLFDPVSGKFVNKDGKFASFGAYQSEVEQLEDEGLIPNSAKTDALLGFMGKNEKDAKPKAFARSDLFGAIDKADGLLDKALDGISESSSISNSLLKEFGINTQLLEAITPEEHQFLKKTVKDAEPIKHKADANNLITRYTKEYVPARNRLIKQIQTVIASIKPATTTPAATATTPSATTTTPERKGSSASESLENTDSKLLLELSLTPQGQKAGAKLFEPDWKGYLSPEQVKHNLALLKKGHAKLDWSDHVGKTVKDWANMASFDLVDKFAAGVSSIGDKNTSYAKERAKQQAIDQAYNQNPNALNLRTAANAVGYKIDPKDPVGNMTLGDVLGVVGPGAVSGMFKLGMKGAQKLGMGKVGQFVTGTGAVVASQKAADALDNVIEPGKIQPSNNTNTNTVTPQPAENLKFDPEVKKIQDYLSGAYGSVKNILPRFGADGKLGKETIAAIERAKKDGKLTPDGKIPGKPTDTTTTTATSTDTTTATNAMADLDPKVVQDALKKLGVSGNQITSDQLLALADQLGIKDGEQVADAGATSNASNATMNTTGGPDMSGSPTSTTVASSDGGLVQGTTATAESIELSRILSLSGLTEDEDLEEGVFDKVLPWVIEKMIEKGMSREANLASRTVTRGMTAAEIAEIRAAKSLAARIEAQGRNAEKVIPSAEKVVPNAEKVVPKVADDAVSKLTADAAKGEGILYKVGKLGGRFARLIKNNKFLSLLAVLAALGIGLYVANKDDKDDVTTQPSTTTTTTTTPSTTTTTQPGGKEEEENKRKLADLEKLLAQLYGGWPTDPETAETIKAAVAVGAKAPEGFKEGGVSTQPASNSNGSYAGLSTREMGKKMDAQAAGSNSGTADAPQKKTAELTQEEKNKIDQAFGNPKLAQAFGAKEAMQKELANSTPEKRAAVKAYLDSKGYDAKKTFGIDFSA